MKVEKPDIFKQKVRDRHRKNRINPLNLQLIVSWVNYFCFVAPTESNPDFAFPRRYINHNAKLK
jgi:hypothetical protein